MRISDWSSDVCSSDLSRTRWWHRPRRRSPRGRFPLLSLPSVSSQLRFGARFVMNSMALDHHGAFFVQTENLDHRALAPELEDRLVQRAHRRDVPEVRTADMDHHLVEHFLVVEGFHERSEERRVGKEWVSTCRIRGRPL